MPKIVDHSQRRREVADALCRVVARGGIEAASVRAVAAEAGWSLGAVQYYFSTRQELLLFASEQLAGDLAERVTALASDKMTDPSPELRLERARLVIEELLPMDDRRYAEQTLWLALVLRSRFDEGLHPVADMSWDGTRSVVRLAVAFLAPHPERLNLEQPLPGPDAEDAARELQIFVDGLFVHGLAFPRRTSDALRADLTGILRRLQARLGAR